MMEPPVRRPLYASLYFQVIVAVVLGVLLGVLAPASAVVMKPLGDAFIKLIKMIIAPVIFCTVVTGIAGMEDMKKLGRTGLYALLYFEVMSTLALLIGLLVVNVLKPGAGLHIDPATLDPAAIAAYAGPEQMSRPVDFLLDIIPATLLGAFTSDNILQVLLVALLFGFALHQLGGRDSAVFRFVESLSRILFAIVGLIMRLAPLGAFGAMAFTIGRYGAGSLWSLAQLMGVFYLTCLIFVFGVLGVVARCNGFRIWRFVRTIREELLVVLGTSSSEAVLPRMMQRLEALGASKSVVGLVIPTGYSFNLDGTAIYLTMAAVFIAQATDTSLTLGQQIGMLMVLLLTSKGAAAVAGGGFVTLSATLASISTVPVAGLTLLLGIDRFMAEIRSITNLIGNGVAVVVISKWEKALDHEQAHRALANPSDYEIHD